MTLRNRCERGSWHLSDIRCDASFHLSSPLVRVACPSFSFPLVLYLFLLLLSSQGFCSAVLILRRAYEATTGLLIRRHLLLSVRVKPVLTRNGH